MANILVVMNSFGNHAWSVSLAARADVILSYVKNVDFPFWSLSWLWYEPDIATTPSDGEMARNANGMQRIIALTRTYTGEKYLFDKRGN